MLKRKMLGKMRPIHDGFKPLHEIADTLCRTLPSLLQK